MSNKLLLKLVFVFFGFCLIVFGVSNFNRYKLIEQSEEHILMARYNYAIECLENTKSSFVSKVSSLVFGEDPFINYNLGVIYSLLGDYNKSAVQYRKAAKAKYPLLKAYAIFNNANIYAT